MRKLLLRLGYWLEDIGGRLVERYRPRQPYDSMARREVAENINDIAPADTPIYGKVTFEPVNEEREKEWRAKLERARDEYNRIREPVWPVQTLDVDDDKKH